MSRERAGAGVLALLGDRELIEELLPRLERTRDPEVRAAPADVLGELADARAIRALGRACGRRGAG